MGEIVESAEITCARARCWVEVANETPSSRFAPEFVARMWRLEGDGGLRVPLVFAAGSPAEIHAASESTALLLAARVLEHTFGALAQGHVALHRYPTIASRRPRRATRTRARACSPQHRDDGSRDPSSLH
jgi:hypothetical protein